MEKVSFSLAAVAQNVLTGDFSQAHLINNLNGMHCSGFDRRFAQNEFPQSIPPNKLRLFDDRQSLQYVTMQDETLCMQPTGDDSDDGMSLSDIADALEAEMLLRNALQLAKSVEWSNVDMSLSSNTPEKIASDDSAYSSIESNASEDLAHYMEICNAEDTSERDLETIRFIDNLQVQSGNPSDFARALHTNFPKYSRNLETGIVPTVVRKVRIFDFSTPSPDDIVKSSQKNAFKVTSNQKPKKAFRK